MEPTRAGKHADSPASDGRVARRERSRPESPPADVFVGRDREMGVLMAGLENAVSGRGHLVLVAGEPGIGKSRLADELAARAKARGVQVLWGRCWEAGGAPAYWPWVHSLRSCLREPDSDVLLAQFGSGASHVAQIIPEVRERFPALSAPQSLDSEAARFCLFEAVTEFLRNVASASPVVVILDDLHAADTPSLLLLRFLAGELAETRILVIGTYRDTELRPGHPLAATLAELARQPVTRSLLLGGLGKLGVARFLEATTGRTPLESLVTAVHSVTEGNPLFVGEVVRLLAHEGQLEHAGDVPFSRLGIPHGIKQVIGRRLSRLSEDGRRILTVASVLGREFNPEVLQPVSALSGDQLLEVLDEAASARVIAEVPNAFGYWRFCHALIRESLYHDLSPTRRMRLHRRVGEVLETLYARSLDSHLEELAYHFIEAAPIGEVDRAIFYARAAAGRAMRLLGYEEAGRLYKMALHALDLKESTDNDVRCELLLALVAHVSSSS